VALTDASQAAVRRYLGYPDVNREAHAELEGALGALSVAGEELVESILAQLAAVETSLETAWAHQQVAQVEDVRFAGAGGIVSLRAEGRRLAEDLAAVFGLTPRRTPFAGGRTSGRAGKG
jgi:hypothetical protein